MRLDRERAVLVVVDAQERLFPHIDGHAALERELVRLVTGCRTLSLPIIVTEQYTKGLGPTIASVREALGSDYDPIEKATFSCAGHEPFVNALDELGRQQVVLCGIEAHVCVYQTAIDLIDRGHFVYLVTDAVGSRRGATRRWRSGESSRRGHVDVGGDGLVRAPRRFGYRRVPRRLEARQIASRATGVLSCGAAELRRGSSVKYVLKGNV